MAVELLIVSQFSLILLLAVYSAPNSLSPMSGQQTHQGSDVHEICLEVWETRVIEDDTDLLPRDPYSKFAFEPVRTGAWSAGDAQLVEQQRSDWGVPWSAYCFSSDWDGNYCLVCQRTASYCHLNSVYHKKHVSRGADHIYAMLTKYRNPREVLGIYKKIYTRPYVSYWWEIQNADKNGVMLGSIPKYPTTAYLHRHTGWILKCDDTAAKQLMHTSLLLRHQVSSVPILRSEFLRTGFGGPKYVHYMVVDARQYVQATSDPLPLMEIYTPTLRLVPGTGEPKVIRWHF